MDLVRDYGRTVAAILGADDAECALNPKPCSLLVPRPSRPSPI